MTDSFADAARNFLKLHPIGTVYPDAIAYDRALYAFLATNLPNIELTSETLRRLAWSIAMLAPRRNA